MNLATSDGMLAIEDKSYLTIVLRFKALDFPRR